MNTNSHKSYIKIIDGADTAVFMVHGITSTPRHFDFILPHIPKNVSVCNILLDGHGSTVRDFSKTSMKKWKSQVRKHLTELSKTHSKILIVAYSLGTLLTMELAGEFESVKAMVLLNPPLKVFVKPVMTKRVLKFSFNKVNKNNCAELATYNDISLKLTPYLWQYLFTIPRFLELLKLCIDTRMIAQNLRIPAHVFFGKEDELVSIKSSEFFSKNNNVTIHTFEHSGHCYYEDAFKVEVIAITEYFLQSLCD